MVKKIMFFLALITGFSMLSFTFDYDSVQTSNNDSLLVSNAITEPELFELPSTNWADSVFGSLTEEQRIAQLFMVAAYSNKDKAHVNSIVNLVEKYKIGGLIFFQGGPIRQANLTNLYQEKAQTPLMISIDGEWGLAMRLDSTIKYPRQMLLGAIKDDKLVYEMGAQIAEQCKRLGIHVNLAPVIDVNNNRLNPVINSRSFGEDKYNVAKKGIAYMKGLQDNGVLANAKHFPGHGDTNADSHKSLPVINHDLDRLNDIELYPFKQLIKEGIGSMMVAHLFIPSLDSTPNQASTLSKKIVTDLLKKDLEFKGLVFTDALNMKGVSSYFKPGVVDVKALLAGNDVLLFSEDVPTAINQIKTAIKNGEITQNDIDERCRRILVAKQWLGLDKQKPIETKNLYKDLNQSKYSALNSKLYKEAVTLLRNENGIVPIKDVENTKIATLVIGNESKNQFQKSTDKYANVSHFNLSKSPTNEQIFKVLSDLNPFDVVLVSVHKTSQSPSRNFGISQETIKLVNSLQEKKKVILTIHGNPYALDKFYGTENVDGLLITYHDNWYASQAAAEVIFGAYPAKGKLPVTASEIYKANEGLETSYINRLRFDYPESVGVSSNDLAEIDAICNQGIKDRAFPGCQVIVAKEGNIIYQKQFGYHTYDKAKPVQEDDIYDLASITKIAASTMSLMQLADSGKINLDYSLCDYIPEMVDTTEYKEMVLREMLSHQAGLASWIPFYQKTLIKGSPRYDIYSIAQSSTYNNRVAENLYITNDYSDEIYRRILGTKVNPNHRYKYSDLGYYLFQKVIEKQVEMPLDSFVSQNFYQPMGLSTMGYKPRNSFDLDRIVPTEKDLLFRKQLVHGDVHDPGAAMLGGVAGHAGLFSSAEDLAKLMQMLVNGGEYGGKRYLSEEVIKEFSDCQFCTGVEGENRRGAGFDKPVRMGTGGPTCQCISFDSFGHSGFTGTLAWADPDEDLVYVFLSNRIYPDAANKKLITGGYRTRIMEVIYKAVENSKELVQ